MATEGKVERYPNRWLQLFLGIVCMATVANAQYGWTLFVAPMQDKWGWSRTAIQLAFTVFIFFETWLVPVEGWLADRFGPGPIVGVGAILVALGWVLNSYADTLKFLYLAAVITGVGAGCVYGTVIGEALKWFPDRRGLAAGAAAAGYGAGAAVTTIPVAAILSNSGYQKAFFVAGIAQGIVIAVCAFLMSKARLDPAIKIVPRVIMSRVEFTPTQILRQPIFWLIYVCFVGIGSAGIMATATFAPVARDYGLAKIPVAALGTALPLLAMAGSFNSLANGLTRPLFGFVSDRIGRENAMFIAFAGEGLAMLGMVVFGHTPLGFLVFAALAYGFYGEIFSLFPSMCADTFGAKNAAGNAGTLYTAKGASSLLVPFAAALSAGGNWNRVFVLSASIALVCACLVMFVLKPWRRRFIAENNAKVDVLMAQTAYQSGPSLMAA